MADDNTFRSYRSNDRQRREPSSPSDSDPLAELARLIGQSDPFAEFGRRDQRQDEQRDEQRAEHRAEQRGRAEPAAAPNDWSFAPDDPHDARERVARDSKYDPNYGSPQGSDYQPNYGATSAAEHWSGQEYHPMAPAADIRPHDDQRYDGQPDDDAHVAADPLSQRYDDGIEEEAEQVENYYLDDAPLQPHEDAMYDDAPRARRHGGLATALVLVGCAMLGTATAYAYRTYYGNPASTQPPPVITADNSTPTKIVPATAGDPQSSKAIQDRLATAEQEQIVSKQEEPVVLKDLGTQAAPRVVLPAPVAPTQAGTAPQRPAGGQPGASEPKKVRTLTIRPDGTDVSGRPVGGLPWPATPPRTTPPAPRAGTAPAHSGGGPISLDPQSNEPQPKTRVATAPPNRTEATSSTGGFVVQLASQKSEAEARAAFRSLQAKFPNELGDRQPIIRRADLGSKGVYYRTMVGPFATAPEASQFCTSYKAAGGQCVVPKNN